MQILAIILVLEILARQSNNEQDVDQNIQDNNYKQKFTTGTNFVKNPNYSKPRVSFIKIFFVKDQLFSSMCFMKDNCGNHKQDLNENQESAKVYFA